MKMTAGARILIGLVAGLTFRIVAGERGAFALPAARLIGGLWLDALRMTIVPLVFGLVMLAIDTIPDMFYTVSNVTADLAVTTLIAGDRQTVAPAEQAREL